MNSVTTEKGKFIAIIDKHVEFLKSNLKQGKRFIADHRAIAQRQVNSYLYDALLCKTITYPEFKELRAYLSDTLCWESITGVKQLSIFDELPNIE